MFNQTMKTKTTLLKFGHPTLSVLLGATLALPFISPKVQAAGYQWSQVATNLASAPPARAFHNMVYDTVRGVTLMHGGVAEPNAPSKNDTWAWDGKTWTFLTNQGPGEFSAGFAFDSDRGVAVLHGGFGSGSPRPTLGNTWEWNGQTWMQVTSNTGPGMRAGCAMAYDPQHQRVLLHGGVRDFDANPVLSDTWAWDGSSWQEIPNANGPVRAQHQMVYDAERQVMVLFGGFGPLGTGPVDTWEFDGAQWHQVATNGPPGARQFPILAYDPVREAIILCSGGTYAPYGGVDFKYCDDVWEWNGSQWTEITPAGTRPQAVQAGAGAFDLRRGRLVQFGGSTNGVVSRQTWEYGLPASSEWFQVATNPATAPPARVHHGMVYDSVRRVTLLHGGVGGAPSFTLMPDTWAWNGNKWMLLSQQGPALWVFGIAYDSNRGVAVLHGGASGLSPWQVVGDTWEWNGQVWSKVNAGGGPGPRLGTAMAYDPVRRRVVLQGGSLEDWQNTIRSDTWAWDGASWQEIPNAGGPKRVIHQMVYDDRRQVMVLFGGLDAYGSAPVDTWEFDGTQWRQAGTNGPPGGRSYPILGYDPLRGVTILTSGGEIPSDGFPTQKYFDDTWEWNGSEWTEVTPEGAHPQAVLLGFGAYDLRRGRLVQFGGTPDEAHKVASRETWEYGFPELILTGIERQPDGSILIQWTGGAPPYQLQSRTNLSEGDWQNLGAPMDQTSVTNPPAGDAEYFRVLRVGAP